MPAIATGHRARYEPEQEEYRGATELLEQTRRQLDIPEAHALAGTERVQHLLVLALTENFLGQIQLSDGQHGGTALRQRARGRENAASAWQRLAFRLRAACAARRQRHH